MVFAVTCSILYTIYVDVFMCVHVCVRAGARVEARSLPLLLPSGFADTHRISQSTWSCQLDWLAREPVSPYQAKGYTCTPTHLAS